MPMPTLPPKWQKISGGSFPRISAFAELRLILHKHSSNGIIGQKGRKGVFEGRESGTGADQVQEGTGLMQELCLSSLPGLAA